MAGFSYNGVDALAADFSQLASLTDDEKWSLLEAGATVIQKFQQDYIRKLFKQHTGKLLGSIKVFRKQNEDGPYALIYPSGNHGTLKKSGKKKSSGEIGYVLEYGSPRIKARHWMENANEAAGDDMEQAMAQAWDEHLQSINL